MFDHGVGDAAGDTTGDARAPRARRVPADVVLASLRDEAPGAACLTELLAVDPAALSADDQLSFLEVLERHVGWLYALQASALVAVAGHSPVRTEITVVRPAGAALATASAASGRPDGGLPSGDVSRGARPVEICLEDLVRDEVASALRWSSGHAQSRITGARLLAADLRQTRDALAAGQISPAHASVIAEGARRLPGYGSDDPAQRARFSWGCEVLQERALRVALASTVTRTRRAVGLAVAALLDAESDVERRRRHRSAYDVMLLDDGDGSAALLARMPAEHAHACMATITALARDPRLEVPCDASAGERRVHALSALIIGADPRPWGPVGERPDRPSDERPDRPSDERPVSFGPRPRLHLDVVISLEALLGLTEQPALLPGGWPISAEAVRGLLDDATMRRLVTEPITGRLLDYGRRVYQVPDALRGFIGARDRTCRFPGCNRRATTCEIDHALAWDDGGTTAPANLGALCTRHHLAKTHGGWRITESREDGSCIWRSPLGRRYDHQPPPLLEPPLTTSAAPHPEPPPEPAPSSTARTAAKGGRSSRGRDSPRGRGRPRASGPVPQCTLPDEPPF